MSDENNEVTEQDLDESYKMDHEEGSYSSKVTIHGPNGKSTHEIDHGDGGYSFDTDTVHADLNKKALEKSGIPASEHKKIARQVHKLVKAKAYLDESVASDTLKPASRSVDDPKSKIEVMQRTLGAMNSMNKGDLTKWYTQAMALIGKEASSLPAGANADANQSSVDMKTGKGPKTRDAMPKLSVREDVEEMFDGEELSEEFRDKATTLFEAAVNARLTVEVAKLEEEFEARLDEELEAIAEEAVNNLDTYLGYVVERWMEENRVAIESTLRSEITEEFIDGLKNLFTEHYIDVPSDKVDVVESLTVKVQELEEQLHEAISVNRELSEAVLDAERQEVFEELSESLTLAQSEKFAALAEGIEFDGDLDVYRTKLSVVKEKYFTPKTHSSNIEEETFEGETLTESTVSVDPSVNRYVQAISRTIKK